MRPIPVRFRGSHGVQSALPSLVTTLLFVATLVGGCGVGNVGGDGDYPPADLSDGGRTHQPPGDGKNGGGEGSQALRFGAIHVATFDGDEFPTYLAHLMGQRVAGIDLHAVPSVEIVNSGASALDATLTAELQGYSHPASQTVHLQPGQTLTPFVDLTFDFGALYDVSAPVSANFAFSLTDAAGNVVQSKAMPVTVLPKNTILWALPGDDGKLQDAFVFASVFVTPHDKARSIDRLLTEAAHYSRFNAMFGYQYHGMVVSDSATLAPGQCATRQAYYSQGENVVAGVNVTCSVCSDYNASYFIVDEDNYSLYLRGSRYYYLIGSPTLGNFADRFAAPKDGFYYHLFCNSSANYSNRTFAIQRTIGDDEGATDQLGAIFMALKHRGMVYTNVPRDFFANAQNVKFPSESLATNSANCIDGSLVFASALESMGMEAGIVRVPEHAFAAVAFQPGSTTWMPIETTMVSSGSASDAVTAGISRWNAEQQAGTMTLLELSEARKIGIKPAPM